MKRLNKIPVIVLGAINGLLFGILLEIILRSTFFSVIYLLSLRTPSGWSISYPEYPYSWYFMPLTLFFIVTFATLLVNRYAANRIKSDVWFWQITGIVTVFFFSLSLIFHDFYDIYYSELEIVDFVDANFVEGLLKAISLIFLISLPIAATFNLLFAFALKSLKSRLP